MNVPTPSRFFPQLGETQANGSSQFFDERQIDMRERNACGFIEIQLAPDSHVLTLFAQGVHAGTYLLKGDESQPLPLMNLSAVWDGTSAPIRAAELPPFACRMMWLALESRIQARDDSLDGQSLDARLNQWAAERFSGAVELVSEEAQGLFYLHQGETLESESFFFERGGFAPYPPRETLRNGGFARLLAHAPSPAGQSRQCLILRLGFLRWGNGALRRYRELAGQKMVVMAQKDLQELTEPWGWKIFIEEGTLRDQHFFAYAQSAAQAYRAVFMEFGNQMEQVVGGMLTARILSETFDALDPELRAALELHRLIPAAFSE